MEFANDIYILKPYINVSFTINKGDEIKVPSAQDIFFRCKQDEIFLQYESARLFLRETEIDDLSLYFDEYNKKYEEGFKLSLIERKFEAALIYYNIIVDLSWAICYLSVEYALYQEGKETKVLNKFLSIEDAYDVMRVAENSITNPNSNGNPLEYLRSVCPEYKESINLVIEFWKSFKESSIRVLYNFIKHKGKPTYYEIEELKGGRLLDFSIDGKRCPIDIADVKMKVGLMDSIKSLNKFDDEVLFPYIKTLFDLLEKQINPSKMIIT